MNKDFLQELGIQADNDGTSTGRESHHNSADHIASYSPVDGKLIARVSVTSKEQYEATVATAQEAFKTWRTTPAPQPPRSSQHRTMRLKKCNKLEVYTGLAVRLGR